MIVKVYYNKNLKMSPAKLAAQVAHCVTRLDLPEYPSKIIVLEARCTKFETLLLQHDSDEFFYFHEDLGLTEVDRGTITCFAFVENIND